MRLTSKKLRKIIREEISNYDYEQDDRDFRDNPPGADFSNLGKMAYDEELASLIGRSRSGLINRFGSAVYREDLEKMEDLAYKVRKKLNQMVPKFDRMWNQRLKDSNRYKRSDADTIVKAVHRMQDHIENVIEALEVGDYESALESGKQFRGQEHHLDVYGEGY